LNQLEPTSYLAVVAMYKLNIGLNIVAGFARNRRFASASSYF